MQIAVTGVATSRFGELWRISPRQLAREVVTQALADARLPIQDIDALYVGNMLSGILGGQENLGAFFAHELGLRCPAFKIEGACASGGLAFYTGALGIKSGQYTRALVLGIEKMTDHSSEQVATGLMGAGGDEERTAGATFPGLYAMIARAYMQRFGVTEKDLAHVAVKNHYHASLNPAAQFKKTVTATEVLQSPKIADPLKLLDCSPISDGAAAVVISAESHVPQKTRPIWLRGAGVGTDSLDLAGRDSLTSLAAVKRAAKTAFAQAKLAPADIDVAEVHDCFTIAEVLALEDLEFYAEGKAAQAIASGETMLGNSRLTVNTSGGLKGCGHPVGATGVKQIVEIVTQLRGEAGKRQVKDAQYGLTHNVGGSGAVAAVHIFSV